MARRTWLQSEIDRLIAMRDVQRLKWREIGAAFGETGASCATRYNYHSAKRRVAAICRGEVPTPRPTRSRAPRGMQEPLPPPVAAEPPVADPKPATRATDPIHRPRYFHDADADMMARIRRQGATAGVLGDPPAGRSALDLKMSGNPG